MKAAPQKLQLVMSPTTPSRESILDEYGELSRQVAAFDPIKKRHEKLRTQILTWYPDLPDEESKALSGDLYDVTITPRETQRRIINMSRVYRGLGRDKFFKVCKVTIEALEEAFGKIGAAAHLVSQQTGPRHVVAVAKASPAAPAKAA